MNKVFVWASPHKPTSEQLNSLSLLGAVEFLDKTNPELFNLMCDIKIDSNLLEIATELLLHVDGKTLVQPAGSPAFQATLGFGIKVGLDQVNVDIWWAFSKRVSQDIKQADGSVKKIAIFKHEGWVKL